MEWKHFDHILGEQNSSTNAKELKMLKKHY